MSDTSHFSQEHLDAVHFWSRFRAELLRFYKKQNNDFTNEQYPEPTIEKIHGFQNHYTLETPRLIIGSSVDDIQEDPEAFRYAYPDYENPVYDEYGMDIGYEWVCVKGGIKEYVVFSEKGRQPLYIFDNHNHALFAWQEALEGGIIKPGAILVRFDHHLDLAAPPPVLSSMDISRSTIRNMIGNDKLNSINIENFTLPAFKSGLFARELFIDGESRQIHFASNVDAEELISQKKFQAFCLDDEDIDSFLKELQMAKDRGIDIVLDIDFDVLDPKLSVEARQNLADLFIRVLPFASLVTCATSPGYGNHSENIAAAKKFVVRYFSQ